MLTWNIDCSKTANALLNIYLQSHENKLFLHLIVLGKYINLNRNRRKLRRQIHFDRNTTRVKTKEHLLENMH